MKTKIPTSKKVKNTNPKDSRALPFQLVQYAEPDRTYYLRSTAKEISNFFPCASKNCITPWPGLSFWTLWIGAHLKNTFGL